MRRQTPRKFAGEAVVVTGAAGGIGRAVCALFAKKGARLALAGRSAAKLRALAATLKTETQIFAGDVGDPAFANKTIAAVVKKWGAPMLLVNNAGQICRAAAQNTSNRQWRELFRVNADGVFYFSRAAVAAMRAANKRGAVVNIASTVALVGAPGIAAYCASKGAALQLTRAMALECAPFGISINAVCPGATESDMLFSHHPPAVGAAQVRARNAAAIPAGIIANPQEVARAVAFAATEPHIVGAALSIDGGYTAQ